MSAFSSHLSREVRLERMRPEQVDAARAECPAIYIPFGSIEWHGRQNPLGLDATKAHEQLVGLAQQIGGIVYPPIFFGTGGGHSDYPYSYMFDPADLLRLTTRLLHLLQRDGFQSVILLSGHYPNRQDYLEPAIVAYRAAGGTMRTLAIVENQIPGVGGDHAARFETSFMLYLHPDTVDLSRLAGRDHERAPAGQNRNWMADEFKSHPCYGLVGQDPRVNSTAAEGKHLTATLIAALARWVRGEDIALTYR